MIASRAVPRSLIVLGIAGVAPACGDAVEPVVVTSVEVTSPVGSLVDVGASAALTATAMNPAGETVGGISFAWTSSSPDVVSITAAGFIEARDVGVATIVADAGSAVGNLAFRVVDADLAGISALARDPFVVALVGTPSGDLETRLREALSDCTTGATGGRLEAIQRCIAAIETEAANAGDPTDRAVLAVLGLFLDQIERLLNL